MAYKYFTYAGNKIILIVTFILSHSMGMELQNNKDENQQELTIRTARSVEEIEKFSDVDRVNSYVSIFKDSSSPFGVYIMLAGNDMVGLMALSLHSKYGVLMAEELTDILSNKQGKGYGTSLREKVTSVMSPYIGKLGLFMENPELPFSYIYSDNEWLWGKNHPSLSSSLKAGYGVVCIAPGMGLVHMVYPCGSLTWNQEKISYLLKASRILMAAFNKIDESSPDSDSLPSQLNLPKVLERNQGEEVVDSFMSILACLDLGKDAEVISALAILGFLIDDLDGLFEASTKVKDFMGSLSQQHRLKLSTMILSSKGFDEMAPSFIKGFAGVSIIKSFTYPFPKTTFLLKNAENLS